jgi:DNA repair exonuclease SbcCD ATPase subunit
MVAVVLTAATAIQQLDDTVQSLESINSVDHFERLGEGVRGGNATEVKALRVKVQETSALIKKLEEKNNLIKSRVQVVKEASQGWVDEAERAAQARRHEEEQAKTLRARLRRERKSIQEKLKGMQQRVKEEVQTRNDKLKEHDKRMAEAEKTSEQKIKARDMHIFVITLTHLRFQDLDSQSAEKDELMSEQLQHIGTSKLQIAKTDTQIAHLEKLAAEGNEVGKHIRAKAKAQLMKIQKKIKSEHSRIGAEQESVESMDKNYTKLQSLPAQIEMNSNKMKAELKYAQATATASNETLNTLLEAHDTVQQQMNTLSEKEKALVAEKADAEKDFEDTKATNWIRTQNINRIKASAERIQDTADSKAAQANSMFNEAQGIIEKASGIKTKIKKVETSTKKWQQVGKLAMASTDKLNSMRAKVSAKTHALESDIVRLSSKTGEAAIFTRT